MKGKILKVKTGYNPNSSSIGVDIAIFFSAAAAGTIIFNTMAAIVSATKASQDSGGEEASPDRARSSVTVQQETERA